MQKTKATASAVKQNVRKPVQNPPSKPQKQPPKRRKGHAPEYVPFSVVIVICVAFLAFALVAFILFFQMLYKPKVAEPMQIVLQNTKEMMPEDFPQICGELHPAQVNIYE